MGFFRDPESQIPISDIRDRDFLIRARSKNPKNPEIPGIRIGIWKSRKNTDCQIPKIRKSWRSGWGFGIFLSFGILISGIRDFYPWDFRKLFLFKIAGVRIFLSSGYPRDFLFPRSGFFSIKKMIIKTYFEGLKILEHRLRPWSEFF